MFAPAFSSEARRQRSTTFAASLRATHLGACSAVRSLVSCRVALQHPLLRGASLVAVAGLAVRQAMQRDASSKSEQHHARASSAVEVKGSKYCITYDPQGGPAGVGHLAVVPRGSNAPDSQDFRDFLYSVDAFANQHKRDLSKGFVAIFDSTHLVWPSMLSLPQIVSAVREHQPPEALRDNTLAIVIVHRDSRWFGLLVTCLVDAVVALTKPDVVPIFTSSRQAADEMLSTHLAGQAKSLLMGA